MLEFAPPTSLLMNLFVICAASGRCRTRAASHGCRTNALNTQGLCTNTPHQPTKTLPKKHLAGKSPGHLTAACHMCNESDEKHQCHRYSGLRHIKRTPHAGMLPHVWPRHKLWLGHTAPAVGRLLAPAVCVPRTDVFGPSSTT